MFNYKFLVFRGAPSARTSVGEAMKAVHSVAKVESKKNPDGSYNVSLVSSSGKVPLKIKANETKQSLTLKLVRLQQLKNVHFNWQTIRILEKCNVPLLSEVAYKLGYKGVMFPDKTLKKKCTFDFLYSRLRDGTGLLKSILLTLSIGEKVRISLINNNAIQLKGDDWTCILNRDDTTLLGNIPRDIKACLTFKLISHPSIRQEARSDSHGNTTYRLKKGKLGISFVPTDKRYHVKNVTRKYK